MKQIQRKLQKLLLGLLFCFACLFVFSIDGYAASGEYTDLMAGAEYDNANDRYFQSEGDGILTSDYTLPENTMLQWHGGNLTIASGVTLTISEGSCLEMTADSITGKSRYFVLEEGATIRILGETALNEHGALKERLNLIHINAEINGTIESDVQGFDASCCDLRLNGTIHSNGPALCVEQCEITFLGGEYLTNGNAVIERKYEQAFACIVTVRGGVFSKDMGKNNLADGVKMNRRADGTYEAIVIPQENSDNTESESGNSEKQESGILAQIKSFWLGVVEKAKEVLGEAIAANGGIKEAWKKPEFIVCMIMTFGIVAGFVYCVYDFIRAPWKEKLKLLKEYIIVIVVVGGGFGLIWQYVNKDIEKQQALTRPQYSEDTEVVKTLIEDELSCMNGLEAYGPGIYQVGKDIQPGVYYMEADDKNANIAPYYVYFSQTPDFEEKEVGIWVSRSFLKLEKGWYVTVIGAHFVEAGRQKAYEPSEKDGIFVYPAGEYLVGQDLAPGTYSYEPANEETFWMQIRDGAITAEEVSWTKYAVEDYNYYDMATIPTTITVTEGQSITVSPWSKAKLTSIE